MRKQIRFAMMLACVTVLASAFTALAADKLAHKDMSFIKDAASGGMMEVALGQMAQEKAKDADVKSFGQRMVTDHGKANDELKALAQQKGVQLPEKMEKKHQSMSDKLNKASAADFDKKYMEMMVKDHKKDVAHFKKQSQNGKDPDLKAWAAKTLPTLEQHLQQAQEVAAKVGAKVK